MNKTLEHVKNLPVKLFINCKSTKRKAIRRNDNSAMNNEFDQAAAAEEVFSREEVYFTSKENIEGYTCLVNVFIR
jgi:hypothetical protein